MKHCLYIQLNIIRSLNVNNLQESKNWSLALILLQASFLNQSHLKAFPYLQKEEEEAGSVVVRLAPALHSLVHNTASFFKLPIWFLTFLNIKFVLLDEELIS